MFIFINLSYLKVMKMFSCKFSIKMFIVVFQEYIITTKLTQDTEENALYTANFLEYKEFLISHHIRQGCGFRIKTRPLHVKAELFKH